MDPDFGPFPDCDSALNWLEQIGSCSKDSFVVKSFTPKDVAERVLIERCKDSKIVFVRGFDNNLPDPEIEKAMANHFSACGEIVRVQLCPTGAPKSVPDRFVRLSIIGEDVKDKVEKLNGSDLGGCKLAVHFETPTAVSFSDNDFPRGRLLRRHYKLFTGSGLDDPKVLVARNALSVKQRNQQLALKEEARKALHEQERKQQLALEEKAHLKELIEQTCFPSVMKEM